MNIQPYLFFDGRCEEAVEFYRDAVGAKVETLMRFEDSPEPIDESSCAGNGIPAGDKVMHASFRIGDSLVMASDDPTGQSTSFQGISLSLTTVDEAETERVFQALAKDGEVQMPLGSTFFSPKFGMLTDRFGVSWMIGMEAETTD